MISSEKKLRSYSAFDTDFVLDGLYFDNGKECFLRLPQKAFVSEIVHELASNTAGVMLRFRTDSESIGIRVKLGLTRDSRADHMAQTGTGGFDLYRGTSCGKTFVGVSRFPEGATQYSATFFFQPNPEKKMFEYEKETGAPVLVYRFPNLFGKWCRPNYNSAVATFCNNIANDLPIQVNDRSVEMELLYIDDLVDEMITALKGEAHRCEFDGVETVPTEGGRYCYCPITHKITLGEIVDLIYSFADQPKTLMIPEIPENSFAKKLYSTYLSYLPKEKVAFPLKMNVDDRGSFTELVHTLNCGQVSINISKPGITKGQHWHNTKWEFFIVVSGHGLIQQRRVGSDEVLNFEVSGDKIEAVHMLPGYTHNIINLSETENLVTVMYCNEIFNPNKPDTYFEPVE